MISSASVKFLLIRDDLRDTMFKIFPGTFTHDGRKVPVKDFNWQENCTTDQNIINSWVHQYPQLKFYGIPTGPANGLIVLDADVKSGGLETIKKYHIPQTLSQTTLSGGKHYVFKYPNNGKVYGNRVGFDDGLDIRGLGGYIAYYGFDNCPIAEAPEWLLEQAENVQKEIDLEKIAGVAPDIACKILQEACENIRSAPEGESNNILNVEAYKIGQLVASNSIDSNEAFNSLFKAAKDRGKPDYEATATIKSGLKGGTENPITSPFPNIQPQLMIPVLETEVNERWTPPFFTRYDLTNMSKLRKPQLFKNWSTEDITITTADGGTGKTTLKIFEAVCLALGEDFLGFECKQEGRTLFIVGEDTQEKIGAMIGVVCKQMKILDDQEKMKKIMNNILVKKADDLCLIDKTRQGFITINNDSFQKVMEAVEDIRPKYIIFDPIASFWGSESSLNDMAKAVSKFMSRLVERSNACVEMINHMGKDSSKTKDMTQFAGRGGSGLPSHARVSRVLRPVFDEEYEEMTGMQLQDGQAAMLCNVNKFSDGSPLYNKPFLIVRDGYLFSRVTLVEQKVKEEQNKMSDNERVFTFIKEERTKKRYPTKDIIIAHFMGANDKLSKERIVRAISYLEYTGHMGEKIKKISNPDIEAGGRVFIITDMEGKEYAN